MGGKGCFRTIPSLISVAMNGNSKQTAVITGASSGIGLGLTKGFLDAGFNVVANSRTITTAGTLTAADDLLLIDGDVGVASTAETIVRAAENRFGRLDVLINNAGIFVPKPFEEYTPEDYQRVVSTNMTGFFYVSQAAVRQMRRNGGGHILTITTTLAQQPVAGVNAALTISPKADSTRSPVVSRLSTPLRAFASTRLRRGSSTRPCIHRSTTNR